MPELVPPPLEPVTLRGSHVALVPLTLAHVPGLVEAAAISRETYALTGVPSTSDGMQAYVETALELYRRGAALPFATVQATTGRVLGSTRFGNIERWRWPPLHVARDRSDDLPDAVEIGWTWLAADVQRSGINTEAKLLMLTHAFEAWVVRRVSLRTDARNGRARAAIERLGAQLDGILRAHMPGYDGEVRATATYSILDTEWPTVRERLVASRAGSGRPPG